MRASKPRRRQLSSTCLLSLQLSIAGQAEQPAMLTTGVNGASLASVSPILSPKQCGRQPAAEQTPAICVPAGPEGAASVVKLAKGLHQPESNGLSGLVQSAEHSTQRSLQGATAEVVDIPC